MEEVKKVFHESIEHYYKKLKSNSANYGELNNKIQKCATEETWHDSTWGLLIAKELGKLYEADVNGLPIDAQTMDNID